MQSVDQTLLALVLRFAAAGTLTFASGILWYLRDRLHPVATWRFLGIVVLLWAMLRWGIFVLAFVDDIITREQLTALSPWINQLSQTFAILVGIGVAVAAWGAREGD